MRAFSINEFIALPGNSKLSVEVCSNDNIEGFIGLRKI